MAVVREAFVLLILKASKPWLKWAKPIQAKPKKIFIPLSQAKPSQPQKTNPSSQAKPSQEQKFNPMSQAKPSQEKTLTKFGGAKPSQENLGSCRALVCRAF